MRILSEITFIQIERPENLVVEIHGIDSSTKKEVQLKADTYESPGYYIKNPKTNHSIFIQKITLGSKNKACLYATDEEKPSKNLLVEMERELTGEPK